MHTEHFGASTSTLKYVWTKNYAASPTVTLTSFNETLPNVPFKTIHEAYITAISHVRTSRLTDVELIYPPSQIALACLYAVAPSLAELWATTKGEQGVLSILPEINAIVRDQGAVPDLERVREIDKRLKICKNPEKIVGSKAYVFVLGCYVRTK